MNWRDEWEAIAGRIDGLRSAAEFLVTTLQISSADSYGLSDKRLAPQARDIVAALSSLLTSHRAALPTGAVVALERFVEKDAPRINDPAVKNLDGLKLRITTLVALRVEVDYHLSHFEAIAHRKAERAFVHLQRSIVVDEETKSKWLTAFSSGEVACEKLGAVHLLLHGIWAFKADATGGRTDLVFGTAIEQDYAEVARVADALVLTEWKIVKDKKETHTVARTAREQMKLYQSGILAGLELSQFRYAVLVSEAQIPRLDDVQENSVLYRHVNIAVDPEVPSRAAKG